MNDACLAEQKKIFFEKLHQRLRFCTVFESSLLHPQFYFDNFISNKKTACFEANIYIIVEKTIISSQNAQFSHKI